MFKQEALIFCTLMLFTVTSLAELKSHASIGFFDNNGVVDTRTISSNIFASYKVSNKYLHANLKNSYNELNGKEVNSEHSLELVGKIFLPETHRYFIKNKIRLLNNDHENINHEQFYILALGYKFSEQNNPYQFEVSSGIGEHKINYTHKNIEPLNQTTFYFNLETKYPVHKHLDFSFDNALFYGSQITKNIANIQITTPITTAASLAFTVKYQYNSDALSQITYSRQTQLHFIYTFM